VHRPALVVGGAAQDDRVVAAAGGKVPADRKIDGVNIWPHLVGDNDAKPAHETFYYYRGLQLEAVRSGPWKMHLAAAAPGVGKKKAGPAKQQLFNLDSDIGESSDVSEANPDVVKRLVALADQMKDDLGLDGTGPGCRPLGRVAKTQPVIDQDGNVRAEFRGPASLK